MSYNDVVHVVLLDLGREVYVDLDPVLRVLFLDGMQKRMEPLGHAKVTDDPSEIDLHTHIKQNKYDVKDMSKHTLDNLVGLEWLKLFMRYQMDFKILCHVCH